MKMGEVILFESFSLTPDYMLMICMVYLVGFFLCFIDFALVACCVVETNI